MNCVEDIYLSKLSRFQSVLQNKAAKCDGASAAFGDILGAVEQRMAAAETPAAPAYDADAYRSFSAVQPPTWRTSLNAPASGSAIDAAVQNASCTTGLDPDLIRAVIQTESSFRPDAVSSAGAEGLMQLMPGTAASLGVKDSFDVHQNVRGGSEYLSRLLERFGDVRLALAAYNTGPGRIGRLNITNADDPAQYGRISERVRGYVDKVLANYEKFSNG